MDNYVNDADVWVLQYIMGYSSDEYLVSVCQKEYSERLISAQVVSLKGMYFI